MIKTILSSISFCHEYVFRGISVLQAILLDSNSFGSLPSLEVCPDIILISRIVKKVLRLGVSQSRCTQVFFERGLLACPTIEERVSLVDTTKVDSLLLISQSPLAVEDLNKSIAVLLPTPYDGYVT